MNLKEKDKQGYYPIERALSSHSDEVTKYLAEKCPEILPEVLQKSNSILDSERKLLEGYLK
jgi:hypothetical protein